MPRTKLDKIFDNKFHEIDYTQQNHTIDFHSDSFIVNGLQLYENLQAEEILDKIDKIVDKYFNEFKNIKKKRVNKKDIEEIYTVMRNKMFPKYTLLNIWYYTSYYFDVDPEKFFESLTISHKTELTNFLLKNKYIENNNLKYF